MAQTLGLRLSDQELTLVQSLIELHHRLGEIPEHTPTAYFRWLLTRDVEQAYQDIQRRRQQVREGG